MENLVVLDTGPFYSALVVIANIEKKRELKILGALSGVILLVSGGSLILTGMVLSVLVGFYTSWMGLFISGIILLIFGCFTLGFHCKSTSHNSIMAAIEDHRPLTHTAMSVSANVNIYGNTTIHEQHYGVSGGANTIQSWTTSNTKSCRNPTAKEL